MVEDAPNNNGTLTSQILVNYSNKKTWKIYFEFLRLPRFHNIFSVDWESINISPFYKLYLADNEMTITFVSWYFYGRSKSSLFVVMHVYKLKMKPVTEWKKLQQAPVSCSHEGKWDIYISLKLRYVKYVRSQNPNHIEISMQLCTIISLAPTWTRLMHYVNNKMYYPESKYGIKKESLSIWNHCAGTILRKRQILTDSRSKHNFKNDSGNFQAEHYEPLQVPSVADRLKVEKKYSRETFSLENINLILPH